MKKLSVLFTVLTVTLSMIACFVVGMAYGDMLCGIQHAGYSAPAYIAFFTALPFLPFIGIFLFLAIHFHKKSK